MYQRSFSRLGVLSVIMEELRKAPAYLSHRTQEGAKAYVNSASQTLAFLKGEDPSETPEMREKRRKHKAMYQKILSEQAVKAAEEKAKAQQNRAQLSWRQRMSLSLQEAKEALQQMTSTKAGVMAVLQHCTASHAAEVALEQGIDVKNVQMVFEKAAAKNSVGYENVVVGYIDAPAASREEVMAFAEKLHKACPVANSMHIEWRQGRPDAHNGDTPRAGELQREMERAVRQVEWSEVRNDGGGVGATPPRTEAAGSSIPQGTPGSQRFFRSSARHLSHSSFIDDDDMFHLPGAKSKEDKAAGREEGSFGATHAADGGHAVPTEAVKSSSAEAPASSKAPPSQSTTGASSITNSSYNAASKQVERGNDASTLKP